MIKQLWSWVQSVFSPPKPVPNVHVHHKDYGYVVAHDLALSAKQPKHVRHEEPEKVRETDGTLFWQDLYREWRKNHEDHLKRRGHKFIEAYVPDNYESGAAHLSDHELAKDIRDTAMFLGHTYRNYRLIRSDKEDKALERYFWLNLLNYPNRAEALWAIWESGVLDDTKKE